MIDHGEAITPEKHYENCAVMASVMKCHVKLSAFA